MVHSGYLPLRIVFGWCALNIFLLGKCLDGAQWISSSFDSVWIVHSGYRSRRIVFGWCTVDIVPLG